MDQFDKVLRWTISRLTAIGFTALIVMMLVMVINIITRPLGHAIIGTYEAVQLLIVIMVAFSLGYAAIEKVHVNMDMVIVRLSRSARRILLIITTFLTLGIWALITWFGFAFASDQTLIREHTTIMEWPIYPLRFVFALGAAIVCLVLILQLYQAFKRSNQ
ncbi:MAG: transporter small permease subunit [Chloroflexi bacterium]|nr:transporter small permease subunit [Chloroflexota bacterium]